MSIITKMRKQTAVYWAFTVYDEYGQPVYSDPVEISCRWEDVAKEFIGSDGSKQLSRSIVYVDRDMVAGGVLKLSELDSGIEDEPFDNTDAFHIKSFSKLPNLKATEYLRTAML